MCFAQHTGVRFPTLVCVYEGLVYRRDTVLEKNTLFYLITNGMESLSLEEPLFFSEKTWKSYISGCLTVNYGPIESPKWLADHGVEIWSGDVVCSNQISTP